MKRKLFTQIKNEWTDNIWMIVELAIVTGAIWFILVLCWETARARFLPKGYDISDVYNLSFRWVTTDSPEFQMPSDSTRYDFLGARNALLSNIRQHPLVEAAGLSENGLPYSLSGCFSGFTPLETYDTLIYTANERIMSPDLVKVFRLRSLTGKSEEELVAMLREGKRLISNNTAYEKQGRNIRNLIGQKIIYTGDSANAFIVGDMIAHISRTDYEYPFGGTVVHPFLEDSVWSSDLSLRVKAGKGQEFVEAFKTTPELRRYGNVYLTDLTSFADIRDSIQRDNTTSVTSRLILIFFLLVIIFLGLLGTFWFRVQQRTGEVAIRIICGATRKQIFTRIISEGLILLLFGCILMSAILWPFYKKLETPLSWETLLVCELVAVALVAFGVIISLLWPACKIMNIQPAIAVKEE